MVKKKIKKLNFEGKYYYISCYLGNLKIPLKCNRKKRDISTIYLGSNRIAIDIKKSKPSMVYGFSMKSPSKWYITDNWMITHNSTLLFKFFHKFKDFRIEDKLSYKRDELIHLIKDFKNSYAFADELISLGNKRKFYDIEQIELIEVLTKYRNNFNIIAGCVPIFFTLDKELLKLVGMHINIIERGIAVVHLPREGRMYADDPWDVKINSKLEEKWSAKKQKNPNFKIPYHRYTTFAGYLYFGKMTEKQEEYYEQLKREKRGDNNIKQQDIPQETFYQKIIRMLKEKKLDEQSLLNLCLYENKKLSNVKVTLNRMLKDEGNSQTLKDFLKEPAKDRDTTLLHNNKLLKELSTIEL